MKNRSIVSSLVSGAVALLILGCHATQQKAAGVGVMADQEEHKTFQLSAGAHIEVFNISGPVSVEGTDGSTAVVSIYRSAPNPDDLAYRKVSVDQTSSGLTITQKDDGTERTSINLLNRVVLKLPRQVSVSGKSISGDFNISGVVGPVRLDSISGSVNARQLNGGLETVSSVSGNVSVAVEHINNVGLRVSNVSGSIYLGIASDLNAELSISNTSGGVSNRIAGLVLDKINASSYSARLGSGGPRIVISNLTGAVVLSRIQKVV